MKNENTEDTLILIPAYNEEKNLVFVIDNLKKYFNEILVVNDGSTDDTKLTLELKKINFINHAINLGQGAALETGFNYFIKMVETVEEDWVKYEDNQKKKFGTTPKVIEWSKNVKNKNSKNKPSKTKTNSRRSKSIDR